MQRAINKTGESILLFRHSQRDIMTWKQEKSIFYCPMCKERVIIRSGEKVVPHFSHLPNADCLLSGGGEGLYHENGKLQLFKWLSRFNMQVELEFYFPEISQRADIFVRIGRKKIAVEFQCSRVSQEEIWQRIQGYKSLGIESLWILGAQHLKRKSAYTFQVNQFLDTFVRSSPQRDYQQLFFYDPFLSQIVILHHLYPLQTSRLFAKQLIYPLHRLHFKHLFQREKLPYEFRSVWLKEVYRLRTQAASSYGEKFKLRRWLYDKGYLLQHLPSICFLPMPYQASLNVPYFKWQSELFVCCLADLKTGDVIKRDQLKKFLYRLYGKDAPDFSKALQIYLQLLQQLGYVDIKSSSIIRTKQKITCYTSSEQAILGDQSFFKHFFTRKKQNTSMITT
ncbi:competence protein CoiA family protein [Oceanobacillus sp. J11TS1]|uniref:competence protein CoiA family protein n=1 Tax=Oceanobacillus sp. J11TS1 TaxID=2807191 RepID=UPI001B2C3B25|nr:competence protein CoiA family protein [Oceanobacillus sp. J11TS1]GIO24417.1 hypothetical protein J11TS1_29980 [Oceanobacillus sp. J11TS1]